MDVYGHYAATRLLLEHDLRDATPPGTGENKSAIAVATAIRCHAGLDLITGMPILIYLLPEAVQMHEIYSEYLPALLETGTRGETTYVVMASAPGYVQLRPTLTETRLHWFSRSSARAILDAHIAGVSHGALSPSHVFAQGDHLFVAGFGLPWAETASVYRAPEGAGEFPADIYAWARTVQHYGSGDPSAALPGDFGKLIGHCLHDDPRERPTAGELVMALEQVLSGASPWSPPARTQPETPMPETSTPEASKLEPASVALLNPAPVNSGPVNLQQDEEPLDVELEADLETDDANEMMADEPELIAETHTPNLEPAAQVLEAESSVAHRAEQISNGPITRSLETITTKEIPPLKTPDIVPEPRLNLSKPALEIIEGDALPIDIDALEAPPHPLVEAVGLEADEPDVPIIVRGANNEPIRIGFDANNDSSGLVKPPMRFSWVGVLAGLIGVGALGWLVVALVGAMTSGLNARPTNVTNKPTVTAPNTSSPNTSSNKPPTVTTPTANNNELLVNFKLEPENGKRGRLVVLEAPAGAALQSGDPLATVPGPVLFPVAGTYRLQVVLDGYNPAETVLKLPTTNSTVILRLQ